MICELTDHLVLALDLNDLPLKQNIPVQCQGLVFSSMFPVNISVRKSHEFTNFEQVVNYYRRHFGFSKYSSPALEILNDHNFGQLRIRVI